MILALKADMRDALLFLSVRAADYMTALLLYRCSEVFFVRHELNMSLVLALQGGSYFDLAVKEAVWFSVVVSGLRASLLSSRWVGKPVSRVLVEVFSCAFLLSLGISLWCNREYAVHSLRLVGNEASSRIRLQGFSSQNRAGDTSLSFRSPRLCQRGCCRSFLLLVTKDY